MLCFDQLLLELVGVKRLCLQRKPLINNYYWCCWRDIVFSVCVSLFLSASSLSLHLSLSLSSYLPLPLYLPSSLDASLLLCLSPCLSHSLIHYGDLYSAPSRLLLRSAPDPCMAKKKSFETRVEYIRKNPWEQSLRQRKPIPHRGTNHRECTGLGCGCTSKRNKE